ncbi:hypothetical protein [Aquimarina sp. MMG016]|uniref:hypothetical protein n=1 Tax=Aquimarina sp. MMG016 TaxID=2822690 RepID=UPI001B3A331F|nr:hypothetical protein [Aquimarina sp. MMG016]MBQ4819420.1 hypothetical protein [Aquimarina sp. MMG016]
MKNNFTSSVIAFFIVAFGVSFGQSNTFPSSGNVGIGTTIPQQKLHLHSNANQAAFMQISGIAPGIIFSQTHNIGPNLLVPAIGLSTSNDHYFPTAIPGDFNVRGGVNRDVLFGTLKTNSIDERMRIKNNGDVGIGTTNPRQKVHIHEDDNKEAFLLLSGIAPGVLFSPSETSSLFVPGIGLSTRNAHYFPTAVSGDFNIRGANNGDVLLGTLTGNAINERMRITNNGDVGIGTTSPNTKLHVEGQIYSSNAIRNNSIKLAGNRGFLKLRRYTEGENNKFNIALEPSTTEVSELWINSDGDFSNGTRVKGKGLLVDQNLSVGGADFQQGFDLAVKGKIIAEELKIRTFANWPDYVFTPEYSIKSLSEVEKYITKHGHLANIPSAKQVQEEGFDLANMNALLLEKIEELTLHTIAQQKELELLKKQVNELSFK